MRQTDRCSLNAFSDAELAVLLAEGDALAYTEIYKRYSAVLCVFAYKRLDNREEARDLVHELFLALWRKRTDINITVTLSTYLFTAVRNRMLDLISHKQVSSRYIESFQNYCLNTENYSADHLVRHNQLHALIEREIAALPPKMRQVFEFSRKSSYNRKEIAAELGLSEQTVKSHLQHAVKILKLKLGAILSIVMYLIHLLLI
ncbi:RNA polymerase sigma-70 factor [Pedobacter sp. HMWF019]|uniref:RNA polymerase sigma factor n=1 Tax=Pedobacter sp. HMWF019 TaxID=2056856 RepID=UPI000D3D5C4A|nr:RNA polymerase sigma-70 factor [Pedobacter sp. HMWF019]PTT02178.1 RNA polymerase sigma-70 factor [Pedobacter sp. HMWF019]